MMNFLSQLNPLGQLSQTASLQQPQQAPTPRPLPDQGQQPAPNRFLSQPGMADALLRLGAGILQANSQGRGFGGSLGHGVEQFAGGLRDGRAAALEEQLRQAEIAKAQREGQFGVRSSGFEGDIARATIILNDPNASERDKAVAQGIVKTAEMGMGQYDPVTQSYVFNPRRRVSMDGTVSEGLPSTGASMPPAQGATAPQAQTGQMLLAPNFDAQGGLVPPRVEGYTPTGNRRVDAELMKKAGEISIEQQGKQSDETRKIVSDAANVGSGAIGVLKKLDEAEEALKSFETGFGGNYRGSYQQLRAMAGDKDADKKAQSYETINRLSKELGAEQLKTFGGSDTNMELQIAINTAIDPNARPESNRLVIQQKRAALEIISEKPKFFESYKSRNNGSLEGIQEAWMNHQRDRWESYRASNPIERTRLKFNPSTGELE